MGKRKHNKDNDDSIRKKIRKLEKKLRKRRSSSKSDDSLYVRSPSPTSRFGDSDYNKEPEILDYESNIENDMRSVVTIAQVHNSDTVLTIQDATDKINTPSTAEELPVTISSDFLDVLGVSKVKEVPLGPKIPEEFSKRWGRILIDGLNKDNKKEFLSTILIPENFQLLKAPILNQEISSVMTESFRNRDKRLERAQNQLGSGIAGLTYIMSSLMEGKDFDNLEMVKKLSEVGQILLDLHYENTINRKMLTLPTLDKKFLAMTQDVKRDAYLFGDNLGEKIKSSKAAEKSGLQIRNINNIGPTTSGPKKYVAQQGNWRGPPRQQGQRVARLGGNKQRTSHPPPKRATQGPTSSVRYNATTTARASYRPTMRK